MSEYAGEYEPGRLRRAAVLGVTELGPGLYRVKGQDEPHYDVEIHADVPCYCKDSEFHGKGCKHFLAARLASGDMKLVMALGEMLLVRDKQNKALERKSA